MYHGTPDERAELRRTVMRPPDDEPEKTEADQLKHEKSQKKEEEEDEEEDEPQDEEEPEEEEEEEEPQDEEPEDDEPEVTLPQNDKTRVIKMKPVKIYRPKLTTKSQRRKAKLAAATREYFPPTQPPETFPVVITTYDLIMKDRPYLAGYPWGFIVVDEGHRLKNMDCKLMREIKQYQSANRLILTGTPLHVSQSTASEIHLI